MAEKILVVSGGITHDATSKNVVAQINSEGDTITLEDKFDETLGKHQIKTSEGPITAGGKYVADRQLFDLVDKLNMNTTPGGGGFNTVINLQRRSGGSGAQVMYLDLSTPSLDTHKPGRSFYDHLQGLGIEAYFVSARPMPVNIVVSMGSNTRRDKTILKSPMEQVEKEKLYTKHHEHIDNVLSSSDYIAFNSVKEEWLAEKAVAQGRDGGKTVIGVVTRSLDREFVKRVILPSCVVQFNYDEFHYITGDDIVGDENTRMDAAVEGLKKIRHLCNGHERYVTLGSNGALVDDGKRIYHVKLDEGLGLEVAKYVARLPGATCGAGDAFGAGITLAEYEFRHKGNPTKMPLCLMKCIRGHEAALKHLGYERALDPVKDFTVALVGLHGIQN